MSDSEYTFTQARKDNDERLLGRLDDLRRGEDMQVLEPFARAYLGMFYEIDDRIDPQKKVAMLANSEVASAVMEGFISSLHRNDIPPPYEIGECLSQDESIPVGYVVLAGYCFPVITG
jgi:hypothetical protein